MYAEAVVVGGGSGGFAAAYTLAGNGVKTILIEKNAGLGGTSVFGGINCYEPGVVMGEVHRLLQQKLSEQEGSCAVCKTVPNSQLFQADSSEYDYGKYPWGLSVTDEDGKYEDTLGRCVSLTGGVPGRYRRFQFEPDAMDKIMQGLLEEYSQNITVMLQTEYLSCNTEGEHVIDVTVRRREEEYVISADYFVDCTGDIFLARDAGCETTIGADAREKYQEPSAREADEADINGVSYVFRVRKSQDSEHIDPYVPSALALEKRVVSCFNLYPNGDININMLPTFTGREYQSLQGDVDAVGRATVLKYWNWLQKEKGMKGYELVSVFPMAGIREGHRLVGRYVLTENDLLTGMEKQQYDCEIAAIADHPMDRHGENGKCKELQIPYLIPVSCLECKEYNNLFVACRGASFSHIAASSARLSRTMLSLGEAVGHEISRRLSR